MSQIQKIGNAVIRFWPIRLLIHKSKGTSFPGFRGIPIYDVVQFFFSQVKTVGMTERASAIAYNFFMAIPPSLIFLFTLIPLLPISRQFEQELYSLIRDVIPGEKNNAYLIEFLKDFINKPRTGLLSIGFLLSLFFSSNAVMGIMRSFDKNYIGLRKRKEYQKRGAALKITIVLFILFLTSILLLVAQGAVLKWIGIRSATVRDIITIVRWVVIILLFFASIAYIYRHAPAVYKKWQIINPGSILAAFLMIICTFGFTWYVNNFGQFNQIYGSIGTVLILMILIFSNSLVLLIGFELNVSISTLQKIADERKQAESGKQTIMA